MENETNIFENGATWLRADFHLHTKSDQEFLSYSGTDSEFIFAYVKQLKSVEISIGVITNHNKFNKAEFVALRKKAKKEGIGLFAGVEFSLKEGIHILIVFDDKWYQGETDNITQFLNQAFYPNTNYFIPPYPNSKFDLSETVEALNQVGYDYFFVVAHIDARNGLFEVLKGRTLDSFIEYDAFSKVLAVQKSGNAENYKRLCDSAKRQIACVEGSDNAHGGIEAIGTGRSTYLKIGDFNFEAVKYALTDFNHRVVAKDRPTIKNSYIKSIAFEGGLLKSKKIDFSPELNSLIGIRGSGKSSILEILRYTLNIPLGAQSMDNTYKSSLIQHVLKSGGKVVVEIVNEHKENYRIEKIYGQKEDIYKNGKLEQEISIDAFFKTPVYFGQKDLSNKDADFEADLIQRLIGTRLKPIQIKISSKHADIENTILEIQKLKNLKQLKDETEKAIQNAKHQLELFKEKGVAEKLKQQTQFDADISKIDETDGTINDYIIELGTLLDNYEHFFLQNLSGSEVNQALFVAANDILNELKKEFNKIIAIKNTSKNLQGKFEEIIKKLHEKKEYLKEEFAKIKREINLPTLNPDDFIKLTKQLNTGQLKLREIEKSETKRENLLTLLNEKLSELNNLLLEEYRILEEEVHRINNAENKLEIEVTFKGNRKKFLAKLQQIFKGTNVRAISYDDIVSKYPDFIEIYKDWNKLHNILNENQVADFKRRFAENWSDLLTFQVTNQVTIKYNGKRLQDHSLGQRASALILFLLAQRDNDVLIIDQPEDDLDNQTIYEEVIKEVKGLKGNMQFIFATHNANIPVLGDSEKVIACKYIDNEEIELCAGTIDHHEIQQQVVSIMEGGKAAFKQRKDIYSIWKIEE